MLILTQFAKSYLKASHSEAKLAESWQGHFARSQGGILTPRTLAQLTPKQGKSKCGYNVQAMQGHRPDGKPKPGVAL